MATLVQTQFDVGGVLLDRPFKVRRLGHFGFNLVNIEEGVQFYCGLLGFKISDVMDWAKRVPDPATLEGLGPTKGYFTRFNTDHHAFVMFPKRIRDAMGQNRRYGPDITINQITWQVGSLAEVVNATTWFEETGVELQRSGRDMPGSNWHSYIYDVDGHTNELYYGMEQIGWNGHSKPLPMHNRRFTEKPALPQIAEYDEIEQALANGVDILDGYRHTNGAAATFDVEGVLLRRPFKIVRLGPVNLFVEDVERAAAFYQHTLGFIPTEESVVDGERCAFLRCNTEHHSMGLFPLTLRERLDFSPHTTSMALGVQLASYRQLRDAVAFLRERGVRVIDNLPSELHPGIDYAAYAFDPDGHAVQLYCNMEQIGWEGQPRPKSLRPLVDPNNWPATLNATSDTYGGEPFLGPWG